MSKRSFATRITLVQKKKITMGSLEEKDRKSFQKHLMSLPDSERRRVYEEAQQVDRYTLDNDDGCEFHEVNRKIPYTELYTHTCGFIDWLIKPEQKDLRGFPGGYATLYDRAITKFETLHKEWGSVFEMCIKSENPLDVDLEHLQAIIKEFDDLKNGKTSKVEAYHRVHDEVAVEYVPEDIRDDLGFKGFDSERMKTRAEASMAGVEFIRAGDKGRREEIETSLDKTTERKRRQAERISKRNLNKEVINRRLRKGTTTIQYDNMSNRDRLRFKRKELETIRVGGKTLGKNLTAT
jgi:hypothetical protein